MASASSDQSPTSPEGTVQIMTVPQGTFRLARLPERDNLRAWDAADEYLLTHLAEQGGPVGAVVVVNDAFGALACALADHDPLSWSDSVLSHLAVGDNLDENNLDPELVAQVPTTELPEVDGLIGTLLIKVPKTLALLEYQLRQIRPLLGPDTIIVAGGMSKHIHSSTLELFVNILGPTTTSLAKKKARLAFTTFDPNTDPGPAPQPTSYEFGKGSAAVTLAGVFANRRLDIGTRFLLENLPKSAGNDVLDLGCGNGIVGVALAQANPEAKVTFVDISYLAVASAQATHARAFEESREDTFVVGDGADDLSSDSFDLVVINPPFHDQHVVGDDTARKMFADAKRVLRVGGELVVIANRHLGHHKAINNNFGNVKTVASNPKFVILSATHH